MLLEPTDKAKDLVSLTCWESPADAERYEASGVYRQQVGKVMDLVTRQTVLITYTYETVDQPAAWK